MEAIAFRLYRVAKLRNYNQHLKLGHDGEKVVGHYREVLRESGCRVFYDIGWDDYNIDHVFLTQGGISTVETQFHCKPA